MAIAATALDRRISVIPRSSKVATTLPPERLICPNPSINAAKAFEGSCFHIAENCSAVKFATLAKSPSPSEPVATMTSNCFTNLEMALPPASASMPREEIVVAMANICGSVNPTKSPAAANLEDISTISDSVVAALFPSSTMVEPNRS
ncbi:hypothetical protein SDC9_128602 [bioreactor metagenome]|uniref:Uncharacterized protein n=1 Tax=bioreactor metagenome TaxID=1076179 RepID=A0A645CXI2_9ZZZZ